MLISFESLSDQLLRAGVSPPHAGRYVAELREHLQDLVEEERMSGLDKQNAEARAAERLGSAEALASAMIERRELRAWSARAPVATYLVAPPVALAVCTAVALALVVLTASVLRGPAGVPVELPAWLHALATAVVAFTNSALAVALGWLLGAMAIRQRSSPVWTVVGLVVLALAGAALQTNLTLPSMTGHGEIGISADFATVSQRLAFAGRLALNLVLTLTPYAGLTLLGRRQAM